MEERDILMLWYGGSKKYLKWSLLLNRDLLTLYLLDWFEEEEVIYQQENTSLAA